MGIPFFMPQRHREYGEVLSYLHAMAGNDLPQKRVVRVACIESLQKVFRKL
jgi:hypothetical protein